MTSPLRFWFTWGVTLALLLLLAAWGLARWNLQDVTHLVSDRLVLLGELRKNALRDFFTTEEAELRFWSINSDIVQAQKSFIQHWDGSESAARGSQYNALHDKLHPMAELFVSKRGYYDFFLIGPAGDVFYTVEKEADFASNLEQGQWSDSALAQVFARAKAERKERTIAISDVQFYGPSGDAPAIFMATAMQDQAGEFLGVIAFQLSTSKLMAIMNYTSGMGETGETYLVGPDKLMRSDSRFITESTVLRQRVDTPTVALALAGEQGARFIRDYRNVDVLSAYTSLQIGDTRWAVMAEVDREEIDAIAAKERPNITGILLLVYGLSLWSIWYWRGAELGEPGMEMAEMDFSRGDSSDGLSG